MTALDKKSEIIQKIIFHANTIPKILSGYQYFYNEELIQILEDYLQLKNIILNNYGRLNKIERKECKIFKNENNLSNLFK